jgi:hypothetical protein
MMEETMITVSEDMRRAWNETVPDVVTPRAGTVATREAYAAALAKQGVPADYIWLVNSLFTTVLDRRNASLADGVQRALGREPRDFANYARETASSGVWNVSALVGAR